MKLRFKSSIITFFQSPKAILFWSILCLACIIRLIVAGTTNGYENDLSLFYYWANNVYQTGISNFYQADIFVDYPPGYIYILYALGGFLSQVSIEVNSISYLIILKLPIIIFDLVAAAFLFYVAKQNMKREQAFGIMILFLFNPWTLINGVVWGQVDIAFSLILVASLFFFSIHKTIQGSILFAIAALIKPQAFIFMPVLLVYLAVKKQWKHLILCMVTGFSTFLLLALPFFLNGEGIKGLINLYSQTLGSYPYASLNTYNFYSLIGYNWVGIKETILTIPIELMSYWAIASTVLVVFYYAIRLTKSRSYYFYLASITIASVYLFVAKMHERYLFPILLCLLMTYIYEKNKHFLFVLIGYSVTTSINLLAVLAIQKTTYTIPYDALLISCSVINIGLFVYLLMIGRYYFRDSNVKEENSKRNILSNPDVAVTQSVDEVSSSKEKYWVSKLRVGAVLLLYAIVAFYQLGVLQAPQQEWISKDRSEYVIFDLGSPQTITQLSTFTGASHQGKLALSSYIDDKWQELTFLENSHTNALAHQVWDIQTTTQYVMLHTIEPGYILHEIAFFNKDNLDVPLPVSINQVSTETINSERLIDEQHLLTAKPTHLTGSYFDEIYHARTALEYDKNMPIYETTHPPLGKLLITLGIQLFGFSPFGWRVTGTIVGVLSLVVIYYFAKHLFVKERYALAAMLLFAVDFMHFTQSRIATIDIYSITFTLLMFYFMSVYAKRSFYKTAFWHTLVPLGLSGLCFGLGIATKWNGFYGGIGLALMLLVVLVQRYREYKKSTKQVSILRKKVREETTTRFSVKQATPHKQYWSAVVATLLFCCLFFVIIPLLIYYFVFYISFSASGQSTSLTSIIDAQKYMFDYHSALVATHPFASVWYEWQLMVKPIWYYVNNAIGQEGITSTIAAFGNPIIWWSGIVTMSATIIWSLYKRHHTISVVYIGFFSQLIPWMFVDRITFIYHFFGMVPFTILSIVYIFSQLEERYKWVAKIRWKFVVIAIFLFILFYPVLSGQPIERTYVDNVLRWFNSWYF